MRTIYKYQMPIPDGVATWDLPVGAKLVRLGVDGAGLSCAWYEQNTTAPTHRWRFEVYGTGWEMFNHGDHVGSYRDGGYIWHVYRSQVVESEEA